MLEVTCVYNVMHCSIDAGHTVLALEIIKKHCLFSFGGRADKKTSKIKPSNNNNKINDYEDKMKMSFCINKINNALVWPVK